MVKPDTDKKRLDPLIARVLKDVKPTDEEIKYANSVANEIMSRLKSKVPDDVGLLLAGSVARGTQMRGDYDIDIFLLFPRQMNKEQMEKKGLELAKRIVNRKKNESYTIKYAEHPYAKLLLKDKGVTADIVPAYKISNASERGTAVDRTQLHNEFVNRSLTTRQRDEVRVLKAFLLAHNIYGAEASTEGFSGYLCELLIYHYSSFAKLLEKVADARMPVVIEPALQKQFMPETEEAKLLCTRFNSRLIVVDPTDSNRNVAANVSEESFARFVLSARALLANPVYSHFYGPKYSDLGSKVRLGEVLRRLDCRLYALRFVLPDIADDILWHQLKRACRMIDASLAKNSFPTVLSLCNISGNEAVLGFLVNNAAMGSTIMHGPEVFMRSASEAFLNAHKSSIISLNGSRLIAIDRAHYRQPELLFKQIMRGKEVILPSYLDSKSAELYIDDLPEKYAKMLYAALMAKTSI